MKEIKIYNTLVVNIASDNYEYKASPVEYAEQNSHTLEMTVHSKTRYQLAHLLEKGHAKRGGGRVSGKPHITPAEQHGSEMLETMIKKGLS